MDETVDTLFNENPALYEILQRRMDSKWEEKVKRMFFGNPGDMSMNMPDGTKMVPDLDWFEARFSPDQDRDEQRAHLMDLASVYGPEHVMTQEQVEAQVEVVRKVKRAAYARTVKPLRAAWLKRKRFYDEAKDFGAF